MAYTIYGLVDPRDGRVYYVGRTIHSLEARLRGHLSEAKRGNRPVGRWLCEVLAHIERPVGIVLQQCSEDDHERADELEGRWIGLLRRVGHPLTNVKPGGVGGRHCSKPGV